MQNTSDEYKARLGRLYCSKYSNANEYNKGQQLLKNAYENGIKWCEYYIDK